MLIEKKVKSGLLIKNKYQFKEEDIINKKAKRRQKIRNLSSNGNQFNLLTDVILQLGDNMEFSSPEFIKLKDLSNNIKKIRN